MSDHSDAVWVAVDRLTKPSRVKIERAEDGGWVNDATDRLAKVAEGSTGRCSVPAYRHVLKVAVADAQAAGTRYAVIPSLWDQSTTALFGGEVGGTGSKPLRERSPADLDLMEIRGIIRDTTRHELAGKGVHSFGDFKPSEIRHLASLVTQTSDDAWWWEYRFTSWGRLLETYLHAQEHTPKPTRLRNTPCPLCHTRQLTLDDDGEAVVVPPIVVEYRDGYIRDAHCDACGATWFRGADLIQLAGLIGTMPDSDAASAIA